VAIVLDIAIPSASSRSSMSAVVAAMACSSVDTRDDEAFLLLGGAMTEWARDPAPAAPAGRRLYLCRSIPHALRFEIASPSARRASAEAAEWTSIAVSSVGAPAGSGGIAGVRAAPGSR